MTYKTPARKTDALEEAANFVKWPKGLADALNARATAKTYASQATAIAAVGRKDLDEEWLTRKAEHDIEQAAKVAPEDFVPFAEARPDVGTLQDLAAIYNRRHRYAQRAVDAEASDYVKLFALLDAAWRKLPAVDVDRMTVAQAAGVEAERDAGRKILRDANISIAKASGMTDGQRKALRTASRKDLDRLPNLDAIIGESQGKSAKAARKVEAKAKAQRATIKAEAQASAKARLGTQAKTSKGAK